MTATGEDVARSLYEQAREIGWDRVRACRAAGVPIASAEEWDAGVCEVVERILQRREAEQERQERRQQRQAQGRATQTRRARQGPTKYLGRAKTLPRSDDMEVTQ